MLPRIKLIVVFYNGRFFKSNEEKLLNALDNNK